MLTYKTAEQTGDIAVIDIDVVRLNDERFTAIKAECNSEAGEHVGAFLVQYDFSTVVQLHRGTPEKHVAFMEHLNSVV